LKRACVVNVLSTSTRRVGATTENVSRQGALIRLEEDVRVRVGALVAVELILNGTVSLNRKCMYCQGVVTRVLERPGMPVKICVRFDHVDFRDLAEAQYVQASTAIM